MMGLTAGDYQRAMARRGAAGGGMMNEAASGMPPPQMWGGGNMPGNYLPHGAPPQQGQMPEMWANALNMMQQAMGGTRQNFSAPYGSKGQQWSAGRDYRDFRGQGINEWRNRALQHGYTPAMYEFAMRDWESRPDHYRAGMASMDNNVLNWYSKWKPDVWRKKMAAAGAGGGMVDRVIGSDPGPGGDGTTGGSLGPNTGRGMMAEAAKPPEKKPDKKKDP
jgi:hypothetical protein